MPLISTYLSKDTVSDLEAKKDAAILHAHETHGIEIALIRALIKTESDNYHAASRIEKHLMKATWYTNTLSDEERKDSNSYYSIGYMQILFGTAKHHGYKGTPEGLMWPKNGIYWGTKHFKKCAIRFKKLEDAISAYNQGTNRKDIYDKDGDGDTDEFANQHYVDKVLKYYKKYGGKIV